MIMPFGKYKNKDLEELPSNYLNWCLDTFEDEDDLYLAIDKEYQYREKTNTHIED